MTAGLSAAEFDLWLAYYHRNGFRTDRQVWATALAGAAASGARPAALVPQFRQRGSSPTAMLAYVSAIPGAEVRTYTTAA